MALAALRAGHKKKDEEVRQPQLPAEQISDLLSNGMCSVQHNAAAQMA